MSNVDTSLEFQVGRILAKVEGLDELREDVRVIRAKNDDTHVKLIQVCADLEIIKAEKKANKKTFSSLRVGAASTCVTLFLTWLFNNFFHP